MTVSGRDRNVERKTCLVVFDVGLIVLIITLTNPQKLFRERIKMCFSIVVNTVGQPQESGWRDPDGRR